MLNGGSAKTRSTEPVCSSASPATQSLSYRRLQSTPWHPSSRRALRLITPQLTISAFCRAGQAVSRSRPMIINLLHLQRMLLNKVPPRLDLFAHQRAEHLVGLEGVVELDLQHRPLGGVERRLPELVGVHLAQALEARDGQALL